MATINGEAAFGTPINVSSARKRPLGGMRLDWLVTLLGCWTVGGIFLDGWAHDHGKVDSSFFTIWHGLLYSGYLALTGVLVITLLINHRAGYSWQKALPAGYNLSVVGALVFGFGGLGDMVWHTLVGIEVNTEALLSPTHLLLALGIALLASGPFRAAWFRLGTGAPGWGKLLPALLSILLIYAIFNFFTQFAHPFVDILAADSRGDGFSTIAQSGGSDVSLGVAGILLQTALLMGVVLFLLYRWSLPFGSLTLIFTVNTALVSLFKDRFYLIPVALLAGLTADALLVQFQPSARRMLALRWFAFSVPVILYSLYFLELGIFGRMIWSVPLWGGSIFLAGIVGLMLSYLVFITNVPKAPAIPD
jgi:hypothetical protein